MNQDTVVELRPLKNALHRLAMEAKAERSGLSPETCHKLYVLLISNLISLGRENEAVAKSLLKKWQKRMLLKIDAKAAWDRKTPEEKKASMQRLDKEIGEKAADALIAAFAKAYRQVYGDPS